MFKNRVDLTGSRLSFLRVVVAVCVLAAAIGLAASPAAASLQDSPHWEFCKRNPNVVAIIVVTPGKTAKGSGQAECFVGTNGADFIDAGGGNDVVAALGGNDIVWGGGGNDVVLGGAGDDELHGGSGDDELFGQAGNDLLIGNAGADHLDAGASSKDAAFGESNKFSANLNDTCKATASWCRISKVGIEFAAHAVFHTLGEAVSTERDTYYFNSRSRPKAHKEHRASKCAKKEVASTGNDNGTERCVEWRYAWSWSVTTFADGTKTGECVRGSSTICPSESNIAARHNAYDYALLEAGELVENDRLGTCKKNCSMTYTVDYGSGGASRTVSSYPKGVAKGTPVDIAVPQDVADDLLLLERVLGAGKGKGNNSKPNGDKGDGGSVISGEASASNSNNINVSVFENGILGPETDKMVAEIIKDGYYGTKDTAKANLAGIDDLWSSAWSAVTDFFSGKMGCWGSCLDPNPNPPDPNPDGGHNNKPPTSTTGDGDDSHDSEVDGDNASGATTGCNCGQV